MSNGSRSLLIDRFIRGTTLLKPRSVAILLMVAGAVAFIISLVVFGEQVLCLLGSTLVVFTGLAINIVARRYAGEVDEDMELADVRVRKLTRRSSARISPQRTPDTIQFPAPSAWETGRPSQMPANGPSSEPDAPSWQEAEPILTALTQRTAEVIRRQGGEVMVTNQREDRSILHVTSRSGKNYSILVYEGSETIDVSDVRGLYSLMTSTGAYGAVFVSSSSFTQQAQEWAQKRAVLLVDGSRVEEIEI